MSRLNKIRSEFHTAKHGEVHGDTDTEYLLSLIKQAENTLHEVAKATKFLQHIPVMGLVYELSETNLITIRGR